MPKKIYSAFKFQLYPLELFILLVGFLFGIVLGSLNDSRRRKQDDELEREIVYLQPSKSSSSKSIISSPNDVILSYSMSTGQSFEVNGKRQRLFKGHLYNYFATDFSVNNQNEQPSYEVTKNCITKISNQGHWTKLYNPTITIPSSGKHYFSIHVVKNQYFVKRQASQKSPNLAISRTDGLIGFFLCKQNPSHQIQQLSRLSEKQSNNITGISAYGFNGRIYNDGDLRTEEKIVKKNKLLNVLINRDEGFLAYELDGETVGLSVLPKDRNIIVPFLEMFAIGSAMVVVG